MTQKIMRQDPHTFLLFSFPLLSLVGEYEKDICERLWLLKQLFQTMIIDEEQHLLF